MKESGEGEERRLVSEGIGQRRGLQDRRRALQGAQRLRAGEIRAPFLCLFASVSFTHCI